MALLLEFAEYSLQGLKEIPKEIACTSRIRQWGVPGKSSSYKAPVASTTVQKSVRKRGIISTLYDPRKKRTETCSKRIENLKDDVNSIHKNIGFPNCISPQELWNAETLTPYGKFIAGSPLSFRLHPIGFDREIFSNITKLIQPTIVSDTPPSTVRLPMEFIPHNSDLVPKWNLSSAEKKHVTSLIISKDQCHTLKQETVEQSKCPLWKKTRSLKSLPVKHTKCLFG